MSLVVLSGYYLGDPLAKKCLSISYQVAGGVDQYDKGVNDIYFVGFWVVAFTFLRASAMKFLFHPIAAKLFGIKPYAKRERFAEQAWAFSCSAVFWTLGMVSVSQKECVCLYMYSEELFHYSTLCIMVRIGSIHHNTGLIILIF